jgi:hypothetical protein
MALTARACQAWGSAALAHGDRSVGAFAAKMRQYGKFGDDFSYREVIKDNLKFMLMKK